MTRNRKIASLIGVGFLIAVGAFWFKNTEAQASSHSTPPAVGLVQAVETVLAANPGTAAIDATLGMRIK
jgi:hypothetical protein